MASRDLAGYLDYLAFVTLFPQLVAGPVERAARLLPQMEPPAEGSADSYVTTRYTLKSTGAAVLDGLANRLDIAGFDRWFGGTRMHHPGGVVWGWTGDSVVDVTQPSPETPKDG